METSISRNLIPEADGESDTLVEEQTEVMLTESDQFWTVVIEHTGSERLIRFSRSSYEDAIALLDRIEEAFDAGVDRIRIEPDQLLSLKAFRHAWVEEPESEFSISAEVS